MKNIKIIHRLAIGFTIVVLLLAASVGSSLFKVGTIKNSIDRMVNLRVPTSEASSRMASHIYASLASLRGWMLTGNPDFKAERAFVWAEIAETGAVMDALSNNWTNPKNIKEWSKFKVTLDEFSAAQKRVEEVAHTAHELPATKILVAEAAPRAAVMVEKITKMIDLERYHTGGKEGDRIQMLGMMADVRGSLGLSLASIRAYLLTAEKKFIDNFTENWAVNEKSFADLSEFQSLLSPEQKAAFDEFRVARAEFEFLPRKMFEIRVSKKWNMANYLLVTEALPLVEDLLAILLGVVQKDGSRAGGMVENQQFLLFEDEKLNTEAINDLYNTQWVLLIAGIIFGTVTATFTANSIATPVVKMTSAMGRLANGKLDIEIPALNRGDEIGKMAGAVRVFKENAIERERLEEKQKALFKELDFQKFALDEHAIVSIADVQGNITYANKKFCEISEYSHEELMGQNHRLLKSNQHPPEFYTDMWKTISRGKVWKGEIKNFKKGGGYYWVLSTIVPTLNDKGKPFQYVSIRADISERKEAEIQAMAASRAKSDLMANMSHELRTPLNAIIGFSDTMIEETFGPIGNDKYREYLNDIQRSGKHLLELINDILDVSAIEANAVELHEENVSLFDIIEASVRLIRPRADQGRVIVTSSIDSEIPQIYADERRVKQVFLNLLSNAVKFTLEGGEVSVSSWLNDDGSLAIAVSDTGIGMSEEEIGKAMTVFGQVDSGLDRKQEGAGLGLPLTKGLMKLHNGTLEIKSEKDRGTLITVIFPKERVVNQATS